MRPQPAVELLVAVLPGEVQVHVAQRGDERVGVADGERVAVGIGDLELVAQRQLDAVDLALEHAGRMGALERDHAATVDAQQHARRLGAPGADHDAAVARMGAEDGDDLLEGRAAHATSDSSRRRIPATGMRTQSGRLLSS